MQGTRSVVHHPVRDFIEPKPFMFLQLHVEIELLNYELETYYDFLEDQVDGATPEQNVARNNLIIVTRSLRSGKERWLSGSIMGQEIWLHFMPKNKNLLLL